MNTESQQRQWERLVPNQMILASAGSGKTYRLTNRFIYLMARGENPETIIALTFTRKAAGEFFDAILRKLASACSDESALAQLQADLELGADVLSHEHVSTMLETLLRRMHLLTLGTLDSFFNAIMRSFPFEFGLGSGFELLEDHEQRIHQRLVLHNIFRGVTRGAAADASQSQFFDAFRLATFGQEEKSLNKLLGDFIKNYHRKYLRGPFENRWGKPETIWKKLPVWLEPGTGSSINVSGEELATLLEAKKTHPKGVKALCDLFEEAAWLDVGGRLPREFKTVCKNLFNALPDIRNGKAEFNAAGCKIKAGPDECRYLLDLVHHLMAIDYTAAMRRTRGIFQVLESYEHQYNERVRRLGKLTFEDVQLFLAGVLKSDSHAAEPTRRVLSLDEQNESRLKIDYRLGARYNHWLLDEFQDTSHLQWRALQNLIDEAVQDDSGARSLFYVGDVKQAIYGWRGGDSRLFQEIFDHYNADVGDDHGAAIHPVGMHQSYRSGPAIIDAVNAIFEPSEALKVMLPRPTFERWSGIWEHHETALPDRTGGTELTVITKPKGHQVLPEEVLYRAALDVLERVRPHEHGIECAVIVRRNRFARGIAEFIRAHSDIPVEVDADIFVGVDNPFSSAVVSLLKVIAHPKDSFAREHVLMTPLANALGGSDEFLSNAFLTRSLEKIHDDGFEPVLESWLESHESKHGSLDPFTSRRAVELQMAARLFDDTGDRSIDAFLDYLTTFSINEPRLGGVVQIMTIHKAKGLGFDMVVLPEIGFNQKNIAEPQSVNLVTCENDDRELEWALDLPNKQISNADPVIREFRERLEADTAFANLCDLYVATTRAKHANHIIVVRPGSTTQNNARVVMDGLEGKGDPLGPDAGFQIEGYDASLVYRHGDAEWFSKTDAELETESMIAEPAIRTDTLSGICRQFPRRDRRLPSAAGKEKSKDDDTEATETITPVNATALAFGNLVHRMFESIDWLDGTGEVEAHLAAVPVHPGEHELAEAAAAEVINALTGSDEVRSAFRRPDKGSSSVELWREQPFEIVLEDDQWFSGTFDRVLIHRNPNGASIVRRAVIVDFKTNNVTTDEQIDAAAQSYAGQMDIYRRALARLLEIPESKITCQLLFTHPARIIDLL